MKRIGIMGGTFNPIHNGHLLLAQWALDSQALDEVWFVPTGVSYLKAEQNVLPGNERLHMTKLAVEDNEAFKVSDIELNREGFTYTYETLEQLKALYPEAAFFFIVGADCLYALENWKAPDRILANCVLLAAVRGNASIEELEKKKTELKKRFGGDIRLFPFMNVEISSTEVRNRVRQGKSIRYLVPEKVREYIVHKGFYHEQN